MARRLALSVLGFALCAVAQPPYAVEPTNVGAVNSLAALVDTLSTEHTSVARSWIVDAQEQLVNGYKFFLVAATDERSQAAAGALGYRRLTLWQFTAACNFERADCSLLRVDALPSQRLSAPAARDALGSILPSVSGGSYGATCAPSCELAQAVAVSELRARVERFAAVNNTITAAAVNVTLVTAEAVLDATAALGGARPTLHSIAWTVDGDGATAVLLAEQRSAECEGASEARSGRGLVALGIVMVCLGGLCIGALAVYYVREYMLHPAGPTWEAMGSGPEDMPLAPSASPAPPEDLAQRQAELADAELALSDAVELTAQGGRGKAAPEGGNR